MNCVLKYLVLALLISACLALKPPKSPPAELLDGYTMNGAIPMADFYVDDTNNGSATHFIFPEKSVDSFIAGAEKIMKRVSVFEISWKQRNLNVNDVMQTLPKDQWIHVAISKYKDMFMDAKVVIFGSMEPWVEAAVLVSFYWLCLAFCALCDSGDV